MIYGGLGVSVPPLLSTLVPPEDVAGHMPVDDFSYSMPSANEEQALLAHIEAHNQGVVDLLDSLNSKIEQWRSVKKY